MQKKWPAYLLFAVVFFASGFLAGGRLINKKNTPNKLTFTRSAKKTSLTNPLLDCELYSDSYLIPINSLKSSVNKIADNYPDVSEVSVYFRDLNNGPWFGINEQAQFAPASLLKLPLMIAYLKKAETVPDLLEKNILYGGTHELAENLTTGDQRLKPNQQYTVDELISRMIDLSDNISFELLLKNIDNSYVKSVHQDLDIIYPIQSTPEDYITVKSYAGLFRVLYNSTYLSREMSEKALSYLVKSEFTEGIRAGVPQNTTVANKYGIKNITEQNTPLQLHDCGIIYVTNKPYILCIMTKGTNLNELKNYIQAVSKKIYDNIDSIK